jgi:subtilisin family serine protease
LSAQSHGGRGRTTLALLAAGGLLTGGIASAAPASAADQPTQDQPKVSQTTSGEKKLGSEDLERLADAQAAGERTVTVMFVARKGEAVQARNQVRELGASIRYKADKLGYFSARVPVSRVTKAATLSSVRALDLDEVVPLPPVDPNGHRGGGGGSAPDASTPDANPYMPTYETGSTEFKRDHRRWDGRGVTIGILDSGVDLGHPALQTTSTGERKIVDWFTATDPLTEGSLVGEDATWLPMLQDATGPTFGPYRGATWTLPAGTFKIRTFDEAGTNVDPSDCEVCGDANRDGDTTDRIGVLYDPATNDVWVDSDDDKSFTDETKMRPYREQFQVGELGRDNPSTGLRESMPFTVDFREDQDVLGTFGPGTGLPDKVDFVDIGIAAGAHGSHVAGITAANDMFGGRMDGQAPGAKLVSARACTFGPGCTAAALTDGMAELAANRGVDIINMSIGGLPALNDGNNARAELYNRIINDLGVQIVLSAGNSGNALNTIGDPSVATDAVSVGASISRATWKANYGSDVRFDKNMLTFSSGGPREDGGFKPNITAPGSAISTTPTWQPGGPVAEAGYGLPPGYSMFNGTSMAAPQAAGAMALLLSAAEQTRLRNADPAALRQAVYSSADYNWKVPAFLQGHGEIDVPEAWELFRRNLSPDTFSVSAPVCTEVWKILSRTEGTGVYNRCAAGAGGQAPGSQRSYPVTITRTSGSAHSGLYRVSLQGNDGTFSTGARYVALPLNRPVTIQLTARPQAGAHSVLLLLDDRRTTGLDHAVMNVVVAGTEMPEPSYSWSKSGVAQRNEATRYYLTVPEGTKALQVEMSGLAAGSQTRFLAFHPYGVGMDSSASTTCYANYNDGNGCNPTSRFYPNPQPGVWEILVESRRTSPLQQNPWTLDATLLGATVDPEVTELASVAKGTPAPVSWTVTNDFGTVTASAKGGPLGSALSEQKTIAHHELKTFTVDVPAGASRLDVQIGNTSDAGADLDLYVSGPSGNKQSADGDSEEAVSYANPAPGTYTIEIDGYDVPAGTTTYDYLDVFFSGALGSVTVDETPFTLDNGQSHEVTGAVTANDSVAAGRSLFGEMQVVSESGAVLGTGQVRVGSVTG